jgi:hypothetical protein
MGFLIFRSQNPSFASFLSDWYNVHAAEHTCETTPWGRKRGSEMLISSRDQ